MLGRRDQERPLHVHDEHRQQLDLRLPDRERRRAHAAGRGRRHRRDRGRAARHGAVEGKPVPVHAEQRHARGAGVRRQRRRGLDVLGTVAGLPAGAIGLAARWVPSARRRRAPASARPLRWRHAGRRPRRCRAAGARRPPGARRPGRARAREGVRPLRDRRPEARRAAAGTVLGHEVVAEDSSGRRVVLVHHVPCGECERCRAGHETTCGRFPEPTIVPGGFAERVRATATIPLPDGASTTRRALSPSRSPASFAPSIEFHADVCSSSAAVRGSPSSRRWSGRATTSWRPTRSPTGSTWRSATAPSRPTGRWTRRCSAPTPAWTARSRR